MDDFYPDFVSKLRTYVMRTALDIRDRHRADDIIAICQRNSSPIYVSSHVQNVTQ